MEDKVNTGNTSVEAAEGNPAPSKKTNKSKAKSQPKKSSRPPTSEMVTAAIKELKDRKGSSLQAIKKYIVATYKVDVEKVAPFIRKYLKAAVSTGAVVQTKGKGASGSFKLSVEKSEAKPKAKVQGASKAAPKEKIRVSKTTTARKPAATKKTTAVKKAAESPKKQPAQKKAAKPAGEKKRAAAEPKSPKSPKAKKAVKAPAAKTKTPKPKKAAGTKAVKATAKK